MDYTPTLLMVPCFAGAPWQLDQLYPLRHWPMRTLRLPEQLDDLENFADFVLAHARDFGRYVLVGDSFGAVISIAAAVREPVGLAGLVLSGGFAKNPINSRSLKALAGLAPFFPGAFYRQLTLRIHAHNLESRFDARGEIPWSAEKTPPESCWTASSNRARWCCQEPVTCSDSHTRAGIARRCTRFSNRIYPLEEAENEQGIEHSRNQ